ncbi:MAG TPA: lanthionine synthetase LanC family protein [Vicinamibacterales bacterium]|nr:lanthionine synthetase LanC family protein [Vicinamibacterales bacterium]
MTSYFEQIAAVVRATRFRSASDVVWFGKSLDRSLTSPFARALPVSQQRGLLLTALQDELYRSFYCPGVASPRMDVDRQPASSAAGTQFAERLSEANCGAGSWEPGWEVRRVVGDAAFVQRHGLEIVAPLSCCWAPSAGGLSAGASASIRLSKEAVGLPGSYLALGDCWSAEAGAGDLLRVYWNVTNDGAITLMRLATRELNAQRVPFHLKVSRQVLWAERSDRAVIYLPRTEYPAARPLLQAMHRDLQLHLKPSVPALTKRLAAGVGLAEDPGNGFSFGEHRCRVIADALILAQEQGKSSLDDRIQVVLDVLQREGIRSDAPYLNAESSDGYDFAAPPISTPVTNRTIEPERLRPAVTATTCVETAHQIGWQICREAHWSGSRCNWMGATSDDSGRAACEALGPHLYAGSSGVAWFLAELHAATGDPTTRKTAVGAIEQALWQSKGIAASDHLGLFVGCSGIALAAARAGTILGEDRLLSRARELAHGLPTASDAVVQADHISGAAGAIAALLSLYHALGDDFLLEKAVALGEILVERAVRTTRHWSWTTTNEHGEANLTGFSHGAAGIGCALMDLSRAARDARYRQAAERGFDYERRWFLPSARNWSDLRGVPRRGGRRHAPPGSHVWCHGAPGIALSRLRAFEITSEPRWKHEAVIALETTYALTERALHAGSMSFSLCHGLGGNAEILRFGEVMLPSQFSAGPLIEDVAAAGIERHANGGTPWPCGALGTTPSLMVGLAGIGYFYLRLANPKLPSILFVQPERFASRSDAASSATPDTVCVGV